MRDSGAEEMAGGGMAMDNSGEERLGGSMEMKEQPGLEARLHRLEEIVAELEAEDLELERALGLFEEGVGHVKEAGKVLAEAKLRVEELLDEGEEEETRPLEDPL